MDYVTWFFMLHAFLVTCLLCKQFQKAHIHQCACTRPSSATISFSSLKYMLILFYDKIILFLIDHTLIERHIPVLLQ